MTCTRAWAGMARRETAAAAAGEVEEFRSACRREEQRAAGEKREREAVH